MTGKIIAKGAEAVLYIEEDRIIKERVEKKYRIPALDKKIRKQRTRREAKILRNAHDAGLPVPRVYYVDLDSKKLSLEYIPGKLLRDIFEEHCIQEITALSKDVGHILAGFHEKNIVHNDLTTSNMILRDNKIYFIDFGLAFTSRRTEDKAMDLVVFKRAIFATHTKNAQNIWENLREAYSTHTGTTEIISRIKKIETRGRYL